MFDEVKLYDPTVKEIITELKKYDGNCRLIFGYYPKDTHILFPKGCGTQNGYTVRIIDGSYHDTVYFELKQ